MGRLKYIYCAVIVLLWSMTGYAHAENDYKFIDKKIPYERIIWDKKPIVLNLKINHERIIHFPSEIRYWLPDSIKLSVSAMSANGVLYFTAHGSFEKTRIRVQEIETQTVYLLDVSSNEVGQYPPEVIILNEDYVENKSNQISVKKSEDDWYIRLARFAAQSLYAPERLMPSDNEIYHIEVDSTSSVPLIRNGYVEAVPLEAWKGGGFYVTAVLIKNISDKHILIEDSRFSKSIKQIEILNDIKTHLLFLDSDIRGKWLAVVPQHMTLSEANTDNDKTCLYLISERPFMESL